MYVSPREGFQMAIKLCPDLASSYYAKAVNYFREVKLKFVEKINSANFPEARPFEDFWSILKDKVCKNS